jgi:hypothetical protein
VGAVGVDVRLRPVRTAYGIGPCVCIQPNAS